MKQYRKLVETILEKGTYKEPARDGMPGSLSYFGYQFRHNLAEGFPLLTTKKLSFKNIVVELLWFLRGDTNIKYLVDNGCNIWNEDAYNYYVKIASKNTDSSWSAIYLETEHGFKMFTFEDFERAIKTLNRSILEKDYSAHGYTLGDCGMQYGKLWRDWEGLVRPEVLSINTDEMSEYEMQKFKEQWEKALRETDKPLIISSKLQPKYLSKGVDQIKKLIEGLKESPTGRRHIVTAWNPSTLEDMALNACHAFVQFNCRELHHAERIKWCQLNLSHNGEVAWDFQNDNRIPKYYLDCQMYQRSADMFLGVPFNIASYSLLTHILAKLCNMIPGEFIHTFGDAHIYDNHLDQIKEQLTREEKPLPKLLISPWLDQSISEKHFENDLNEWIHSISPSDFGIDQYDPHPPIKGKLSTGLK